MSNTESRETITTSQLLIVDKNGRTRIRLSVYDWDPGIHGTGNQQPMVELLDEYGTTRGWVGLGSGGALQFQSLDAPQAAPVAQEQST